ncbi:2-amino-4-hydroxy-6-hydroxymethyldihydropteridine diphosphokinase [Bifidobacterium saguinibicoloris]|uniref:2-amino-4-hydroxy-6- hydroxymethyldihydropteridine diphosphokinase n=1 Tax=Bifidobacterium saguinibicoloris TaxID=2834433 RepID=UPI001C579EC7|nr:2-amino-4-hydroxy-6-hydroxymethyldihydropteridine diphosphokinase [Bifidobacterium saguinibicoloris]MBW3080502.1 2-amino-4-hydroxy-6-hydroxymethyldihydropteridine diphosphokinase [Bifidobacterium saguinibicoloris]
MDTIRLTGVRANGTHGVLDFEHERAQTFIVDATLHLDLTRAGLTDALEDTVDYGRIARDITDVIEGDHVDLIEALAQRIADRILAHVAVAAVDVTVHKPHAPITVPFDDVAVTITRGRTEGAAEAHTTDACAASVASDVIHRTVIALGGNQGDVAATLRAAVRDIDALDGTQIVGVSPLYRTAAWGMLDGTPDFLNAVVEATTLLDARDLLAALRRIETAHGRTHTEHWADRPLDLDIIDYDGRESDDPALTLPHPRAWQRAFVLVPWSALDPKADLPGMHGGPVAELAEGILAEADPDEPPVTLEARDWMSGTRTDTAAATTRTAAPAATTAPNEGQVGQSDGVHAGDGLTSRRAVISMDSTRTDAERLFREAIVAIDGIPGNQVEGISPLYHVSNLDGPDAMAAVIQVETKLGARELIGALDAIEHGRAGAEPGDGARALDLDLIDMDGVTCDEPDCRVPWPTAREHASVLAPWMDMDPEARLGGDPVSFLLAMAPDAGRVGLLSDNWIIQGGEGDLR